MMASILSNSAGRNHEKQRKKVHLPLSAWLSYLVIATLILSSISLARYTVISSESDTARTANFSVWATMKGTQNNEITLVDGGKCEFEVTNGSEVSVIYKVIIKGLPNSVDTTLTVGDEPIPMTYNPETEGELISAGKVLESNKTDICTLLFAAPEEVTGTHDISVQVQFEQIN